MSADEKIAEGAESEVLNGSDSSAVHKEDQPDAIDPILEKKILRKTDWHLIPILWLLQLCSFIDRINIGNARIQGLEADLNMTGNDFNIALFLFFIPYILLEVPSNLILKHCRPSLYIGGMIFFWGVLTVCHGLTKSFGGLIACRVLMGVFESGFFPACVYLMSMYYKRHEIQSRFTIYFSSGIVAGATSGLLAYAISHMEGVGGYASWRWIFILEGLATIVIAVASFWMVPDWPETAKFLEPEERAIIMRRVTEDRAGATMNHWNKQTAKRIFSDVKIYLGVLMYIGITTTTYSGSLFIPTILRQLGWTAVKAQVMSIPIYAVALVSTLTVAFVSDKLKHRYGFIIGGSLIATIGYIILLNMLSVKVGVRYFAVFLFLTGGFIVHPMIIIWLSNNVSGHYKSGVSSAMQLGFGNISGIIASNIYISRQAPTFKLGFGFGLGFVWVNVLSATALLFVLVRENKLRNAGKRDDRYNLPEEELKNLGDDHPSFRFTY